MKLGISILILCTCLILACASPVIKDNNGKKLNKNEQKSSKVPVTKQKMSRLQGFEGFGHEQDASEEKIDEESGIEFIPVSLKHPLFKVFGINPDDYVVYYKYKRSSGQTFDPNIKFNEIDLVRNAMRDKKNFNNHDLKRLNRQVYDLNKFDEDDTVPYEHELDYFPETSALRKRSSGPVSMVHPFMGPYVPYPMPMPYYPQPYPYYPPPPPCYNNLPHTPCGYPKLNPCKQCPYDSPDLYTVLKDSNNATVLRYPDTVNHDKPCTSRRRRRYAHFLKK